MRQVLLIVLVSGLVCACTTVRIESGDGAARIDRAFGVVSLRLDPHEEPVIARVTTLGLGHSTFGTSFGYSHQEVAVLPRRCQVVFWIDDANRLEHVRSLLAGGDEVCPMLLEGDR